MLDNVIQCVHRFIWGWPLILLVLFVGVYMSIRTRFVQVRLLKHAFQQVVKREPGGNGEVSVFASLCTTLSATIGTGNVVGVAGAVVLGGPGALLWMEVAAFFGMAVKYAEAFLAVQYRECVGDGRYIGGPFLYIERGMGKRWRWLAKAFSLFGVLAGLLGIGSLTQSSSITVALEELFPIASQNVAFSVGGKPVSVVTVIGAAAVTFAAAFVIIGGVKRIAGMSQVVVPLMALLYVVAVVVIVLCNLSRVPAVISLVFHSAFSPQAALGAVAGISLKETMQKGIGRGIFSNEAGLGSAPIAAAAAKTDHPVKQGLVFMTATFIDTIVICTLTGLAVLLTGAWQQAGLEGVEITAYAWQMGLPLPPAISTALLMICLVFFSFTTIVGWEYYYECCAIYLMGNGRRMIAVFRWLYILAVFVGPFISVSSVWNIAEISNALMSLPNLIALLSLGTVVEKDTLAYLRKST